MATFRTKDITSPAWRAAASIKSKPREPRAKRDPRLASPGMLAWSDEMRKGPGIFSLMKLPSLPNMRLFWRAKSELAASQRFEASLMAASLIRKQSLTFGEMSKVRVKLTRYGPKTLDADNAIASFKNVQDGIAEAVGIDDGSKRIKFVVKQVKARWGGVRIEIEVK